jgi:gamma-resorcylate decarboxylase
MACYGAYTGSSHVPKGAHRMMTAKIALEEHFLSPSTPTPTWPASGDPATNANDPIYFQDVRRRLVDVSLRIEEMDRCGIEMMVLSLNQPGVQAINVAPKAIETARRVNDELAERFVGAHPTRFAGFAAIPLQDVTAAGDELERAVTQLGFKGALINGYSNIGERDAVQYLDETPVWEFWERVAALNVPVYLHPREPLERRMYEGYPALVGSAWGFGIETATHTLRLIMSGLFV